MTVPTTARRTRPLLAAALVAVVAPSTVEAQTIELGFGWRPGMAAEVRMENVTETEAAGMAFSVFFRTRHRSVVSETADGFQISNSDYEVLDFDTPMGAAPVTPELLAASQPSILVSRDGAFIDIVDAEGRAATVREELAAAQEELPPGMGGVLEGFADVEALRRTAEEQWRGVVGWWVGRTATAGETEFSTLTQQLPVPGLDAIEVDVEMTMTGRVDCVQESGANDCVELVVLGRPTEASLTAAMAGLVGRMTEQMGGMVSPGQLAIDEWALETETRLIAEPETLVPYRSEIVVEQTMTMAVMGMSQSTWTVNSTTTEYDWEGR